MVSKIKTGVFLIEQERSRQIQVEGWNEKHDAEHEEGELAMLAVCYATPNLLYKREQNGDNILFVDPYPSYWDEQWDKRQRNMVGLIPNNMLTKRKRIRNLVKAGALIAAEIDRLQRNK